MLKGFGPRRLPPVDPPIGRIGDAILLTSADGKENRVNLVLALSHSVTRAQSVRIVRL